LADQAAALADAANHRFMGSDAAANRNKSLQLVNGYTAVQASQQLITTVKDVYQTNLPIPAPISTGGLAQQLPAQRIRGAYNPHGVPIEFAPSAAYTAAQNADLAFFPDLDQTDPAFLSLVNEVNEAYGAGYYDDTFSPQSQIFR
jgi:hypothetical protein